MPLASYPLFLANMIALTTSASAQNAANIAFITSFCAEIDKFVSTAIVSPAGSPPMTSPVGPVTGTGKLI